MKLRYHVVSTIKVIVEFTENMSLTQSRGATVKLSQARPNILPQNFLTGCFLYKRIESQNLGKAQALGALPALAPLQRQDIFTRILSELKLNEGNRLQSVKLH